jgi:hypothetical protein
VNFFKKLGKNSGSEFFGELKMSYQLTAAVSPLVLLLPRKTTSNKIRRDALLYVSPNCS